MPLGSVAQRSDLITCIAFGDARRGRRPIAQKERQACRTASSDALSLDMMPPNRASDVRWALSNRALRFCVYRVKKSPRRGGTGPKNTIFLTASGCAIE